LLLPYETQGHPRYLFNPRLFPKSKPQKVQFHADKMSRPQCADFYTAERSSLDWGGSFGGRGDCCDPAIDAIGYA
jgi:hypothetical protein